MAALSFVVKALKSFKSLLQPTAYGLLVTDYQWEKSCGEELTGAAGWVNVPHCIQWDYIDNCTFLERHNVP